MRSHSINVYLRGIFASLALVVMVLAVSLSNMGCLPSEGLDGNANLSSLEASPTLNQTFSPSRTDYSITIESSVPSVSITPSFTGTGATMTVQVNQGVKQSKTSGSSTEIAVNELPFDINIEVTAQSGITKTYTISVTEAPSDNAFLASVVFSQGQLFPAIVDGEVLTLTYDANVPFITTTVTLIAELSDPRATMTVGDFEVASGQRSGSLLLTEGDNSIEIVVTAEDGTTTSTYQLNVNRSTEREFAYHTYIKASNTDILDEFGGSAAMWGNTLVVGAPWEDSNSNEINGDHLDNSNENSGAAYIYVKDVNGIWSFDGYLKSPNSEANDQFGYSVAISNDTIVVGAWQEDSAADVDDADNSALRAGAVYVYTRDESNNWNFTALIKASNAEEDDRFGSSLALSATHLVVGAPSEDSSARGINGDQTDNSATLAGAVYVYALDDENIWQQQAYIKSSNTDIGDKFGEHLALSGNTLVVSSIFEASNATGVNGNQNDNSIPLAGAVYIYNFDKVNGWLHQNYIKASNTDEFDRFGSSISISGNTLVIGAEIENSSGEQDSNDLNASGAVYVFVRDSSLNWSQQSYLKASNPGRLHRFGHSTYLTGDSLTIGAIGETGLDTGIDGDQTLTSTESGAAYYFTRNESNLWEQIHYIKASNTDRGDVFARNITGYSDDLAFSALAEDSGSTFFEGDESDNSAPEAGAAYIYRNSPVTNHNLALTTNSFGSSADKISLVNLDTGVSLDDCIDNCSQLIDRGQTVQLTPVAGNSTSEFLEWKGDSNCTASVDSSGVSTVTINGDLYCLAVFREVVTEDILLTINKDASSTGDGLIEATNDGNIVASCDVGCTTDTSLALDADIVIELTATPEAGSKVTGWSGDAACQANANGDNTATSITMDVSKTCTSKFDLLATSLLTLRVDNLSGSSGAIAGLNLDSGEVFDNCSTECAEQIINGQNIQLTPIPAAGSEFVAWNGDSECVVDVTAESVATFVVTADILCVAEFTVPEVVEISLTLEKDLSSTADGFIQAFDSDGNVIASCDVDCMADVSMSLAVNSVVELTANPEVNALISSWSGDPQCQANANVDNTSTTVTLSESLSCIAKFDLIETSELKLRVDGVSGGSGKLEVVNLDSGVVLSECSSQCTHQIIDGESVQLSPVPTVGSKFTGWSGDAVCLTNITSGGVSTVLIESATFCIAEFQPDTKQLDLNVANSLGSSGVISAINLVTGQVYDNCSASCIEQIITGQTLQLIATPAVGSEFIGWSGDAACLTNISAEGVATVVVNNDTSCTAGFTVPDTGDITITITKDGTQTGDGNISAIMFDFELVACPSGCTSATSMGVDVDAFILLFATPDADSGFIEWSGDAECSANAAGTQTSVTLTVAKTCIAKFDLLPAR